MDKENSCSKKKPGKQLLCGAAESFFCKLLTQNSNSLFVISFGEWRVFGLVCFPPGMSYPLSV